MAGKSVNRYQVTNKGMMKGYYKIVDVYTGDTVQSGFTSKRAAMEVAYNLSMRPFKSICISGQVKG